MPDELYTLLEAAMAANLEKLHTAIPGRITKVVGTGTVNVQPTLRRTLRDGTTETLPVIPNVPVWFPRGGGASITWPISKGDGCLLVFSERSLDEWKISGDATASDPRKHALADAVAFVGLSAGGEGSDDLTLTQGDSAIVVSDDAVTMTAGGVTMTLNSSGLTTSGSLTINGDSVTHGGTNIGNSHVHGGVTSGASETETPS